MELFLQSMALPFLACLILTGIHVYLGLHVIERKVIFVDLALAQLAALGAAVGHLLSGHSDSFATYLYSFGFTLAASRDPPSRGRRPCRAAYS